MRILVLTSEIPFPPTTGAQLRTYHLLKSFLEKDELTLVGFSWDSSNSTEVDSWPLTIVRVPWAPSASYRQIHDANSTEWQAAYHHLAYESPEPWIVSYYDSPAMAHSLAHLALKHFDLILIEHSFMGRFLPLLPPYVPKVMDLHNVHTLMAWRRAEEACSDGKLDSAKEFARMRSFEQWACRACQLCLCCSEKEKQEARRLLGINHMKVIPNGVDTVAMVPGKQSPTPGYVLFTGMMNYEPNGEAVQFFARRVLPLVRAQLPHVEFHVAGANPPPHIQALEGNGVFVHGFVPDMRPFFHQASVVVVPLLHGGGTRLKVLEAAACGKPIVSTSLGAEGLNFVDGRDLLLADSAPEFARAVVAILSAPDTHTEMSRRARSAAEAYDWAQITSEFYSTVCAIADTKAIRPVPFFETASSKYARKT